MLAALMDSRLLPPFIFLLCSLVCVFLVFSQQLLKPRRWWRGRPAGNLLWFWVFVVCRDEGNGRDNTRLCVLLLSCSLRPSVFYFFLWIYALFFLCSFLRFLVFRLGLASVLPLPVFVFHPGSWPVRPSLFSGFFLWVLLEFFLPLLLCSALPFIELESLKTSPVFAGLLFKSRTGSWAGDVVHDLLQISCWIGFLCANRKGLMNSASKRRRLCPWVWLFFTLAPKRFKLNNWDLNQ